MKSRCESRITVDIDRPFQVGIVGYQMAKLRIMQFYYDCLDKFLDRRDIELIQMDTDSLYLALSCDSLEKRWCVRHCLMSSEHAKKNGSLGTNGVSRSLGCSSWNSRAPAELLCAASVISWRMTMEG